MPGGAAAARALPRQTLSRSLPTEAIMPMPVITTGSLVAAGALQRTTQSILFVPKRPGGNPPWSPNFYGPLIAAS